MGTSASVLGASGYVGGELLRLLAGHPTISVVSVAGGVHAGERLDVLHPHLAATFDLDLGTIANAAAADLCFSCLPHGVLPGHLGDLEAAVVIDLAQDHRSDPAWTYGLPELNRRALAGTSRVANPGCYPTASLLALVPFARAGFIEGPVIIDALSGVSGAGRSPRDELLFSTLDGGVSSYGNVEHRHVAEIERGLSAFGPATTTVSFTPHLVPMSRGLLVTARFHTEDLRSDHDALEVLRASYESEAFVQVIEGWPGTKSVAGTNRAHVSARVDRRAGFVICSCAIDNLGKGAAGQAVQNANLALGLEETTGLEGLAVWP
jgi:N-acetyl-gamma-glutamyl-phosphate reductase